jgi:RNA polymerase sigma-B factor
VRIGPLAATARHRADDLPAAQTTRSRCIAGPFIGRGLLAARSAAVIGQVDYMGATSTLARPAVRSLARAAVIVAPLEIPLNVAELGAPPTSEELLGRRCNLAIGHPDRATIRAEVVEAHLPMARRLARRYGAAGGLSEDLAQVAALALVKAVDAYDPHRQVPFVGYAVPTIIGALKRYFRDSTWAMRVPRGTKATVLQLRTATDDLSQLRGQPPTPTELAAHLQMRVEDVWAATLAAQAYRLESLDTPRMRDDHRSSDTLVALGAIEVRYAQIDDELAVGAVMAGLPARERRILTMRFYDEMTQASIAAELGLSQMHVSRLLRQTLTRLRLDLEGTEAELLLRTAARPRSAQGEAVARRRSA